MANKLDSDKDADYPVDRNQMHFIATLDPFLSTAAQSLFMSSCKGDFQKVETKENVNIQTRKSAAGGFIYYYPYFMPCFYIISLFHVEVFCEV